MPVKHQDIISLVLCGLGRLKDVQGLADVAVLGLKELAEPSAIVGEAHVQHGLQRNPNFRIRMFGLRCLAGLGRFLAGDLG